MKLKLLASVLVLVMAFVWQAHAVFRFPIPEFESGYQHPEMNLPPNAKTSPALDVLLLVAALTVTAWAVLKSRSRRMVFLMALGSLLYFGFYRRGCVCPVGSIQNMAAAVMDRSFQMPYVVAAFFLIPLVFALYFGRVFCAAVCPLGAAQEMCAAYPVQVPRTVDNVLTLFPYAYLGIALLAIYVLPAFTTLYSSFDVDLPWITRALMSATAWLRQFGPYILLVLLAGVLGLLLYTRSPAGRYQWDEIALRIPLIGRILLLNELARCCRTVSLRKAANQQGGFVVQGKDTLYGLVFLQAGPEIVPVYRPDRPFNVLRL